MISAAALLEVTSAGLSPLSVCAPGGDRVTTHSTTTREIAFLFDECRKELLQYLRTASPSTSDRHGMLLEQLTKLWIEIRLQALLSKSTSKGTPIELGDLFPGMFSMKSLRETPISPSSFNKLMSWVDNSTRQNATRMVAVLSFITVDAACGIAIIHPLHLSASMLVS